MVRMKCTLLLFVLCASHVRAQAKSSYAELIEEDKLDLSIMEKNARTFLRFVEHRGGRKITQDEMRDSYAANVGQLRELEQKVTGDFGQEQVQAIRNWVKAVAPAIDEAASPGLRYDTHGPLHLVLQKASSLLGREHNDVDHPYREAKKIVGDIRRFTEAIVKYFREREADEQAKQEL